MGAAVSQPKTAFNHALDSYAKVTSGDALDASSIRSRILRGVAAPKRARRGHALVLPLVATLAASAALAATQPAVRALATTHLQAWLGPAPAPAKPRPLARRSQTAPAPSPAALESSGASRPLSKPIAVDELPLAAPTIATAGAHAAATGEHPPGRELGGEADPQLEAYRAAHRTHFDARSPSAALAAWDRYLADFPDGSFATDARFNRALCLVRLGRLAEARAALMPFALAAPGDYRQAEAAALLQSLIGSLPRLSETR